VTRRLATGLAVTLALLLLAGALGRFAAPLDSLSLLRMPAAAALLALTLLLSGLWRVAAAVLAVVALAGWIRLDGADEGPGDLRLYQKNTFFSNAQGERLVEDILATGADVVTLQELSSRNGAVLSGLAQSYPHAHACSYRGWSVAVLSRHPMVKGSAVCSRGRGMALVQLAAPAGQVWVASVHVPWPWPHVGWRRARELAAQIAPLEGPVVVAGDFNMVPWSHGVRGIAQAAKAQVLGPALGTLHLDLWALARGSHHWTGLTGRPVPLRHVPMSIDHVIAPAGGVSKRPLLGSDHKGLLAEISLTQAD
jgi:endonuclease/exonuclease/phosphatase (EEP) superfamily protein YafD